MTSILRRPGLRPYCAREVFCGYSEDPMRENDAWAPGDDEELKRLKEIAISTVC